VESCRGTKRGCVFHRISVLSWGRDHTCRGFVCSRSVC